MTPVGLGRHHQASRSDGGNQTMNHRRCAGQRPAAADPSPGVLALRRGGHSPADRRPRGRLRRSPCRRHPRRGRPGSRAVGRGRRRHHHGHPARPAGGPPRRGGGERLVGTAAAFVVWFQETQRCALGRLAAWTFLVPVFGVLLGVVVLGERPGWWTAAGLALVLGSLWPALRPPRKVVTAVDGPVADPASTARTKTRISRARSSR